jgi:hypothetical protein
MQKLRYEYSKLCESAIEIAINDGYVIIACKKPDRHKEDLYHVSLFIKEETVDTLNLIQEQSSIKFETEETWINVKILKYVSDLYTNGYFDKYINGYEYMLACFDKGNQLFEEENRE